jgi:4-hydroxythreonine-4-phosphate dehydrogenase
VRAVVTNPIAKATLYQAGFRYPGHTEYLGALAEAWGAPAFPVMMIWSETLAVAPVTIHIPLADVAMALTAELIIKTGRIVDRDLRARFHLTRPRLAVAGLNPHAGEGGAMGREEITIIGPAIETLRDEGIEIVGPLPADTMFHPKARARYDVALTMYHDQGLIPVRPSLSTKASMSRSVCRSCAHRPITARRSTSPERGSRIRRASLRRSSSPTD